MSDTASKNIILDVVNYRKVYSKKVVVPNLSLQVCAGDIFGYIGHNGAGKTTLIRSIVGAQPIDGGSISVCGFDVEKNPVKCKQQIAYVPDNPDIYDFMTGIAYLNYIADMFGVDPTTRVSQIEAYAKRLGIEGALGSQISSYSHGMRQKLVIISAFLHKPALFVLDEPFVGLDPAAAFEVKKMMGEAAANGAAVFFSSHVLEVVEKLCNKVAILRTGEIIACGNTEDVRGDESLEQVFMELIANEKNSDGNNNEATTNTSN